MEVRDKVVAITGATGAILVIKALYELARTGGRRALPANPRSFPF